MLKRLVKIEKNISSEKYSFLLGQNKENGENKMKEERGNFSSKLGFILAAAGSAVGLGNLWRFPYLAAQYGGGIFLFVYLILVLTFGFSMLAMEIAIGRKTKVSGIKAYSIFRISGSINSCYHPSIL